ncbi:MAG: hypothetical protein ABSD78_10240 [Acidimicrobiales bacterium]|jgi:hypothetical protein
MTARTRESGPQGAALTIVDLASQQGQSSSEPYFGGHRGPLPLVDLAEYAGRFADLGSGVDGMTDAEVCELLGSVLRRVAHSLRYLLRGAA